MLRMCRPCRDPESSSSSACLGKLGKEILRGMLSAGGGCTRGGCGGGIGG